MFKSELSLHNILYDLTYKELIYLAKAREAQILKEHKENETMLKNQENMNIRNSILKK